MKYDMGCKSKNHYNQGKHIIKWINEVHKFGRLCHFSVYKNQFAKLLSARVFLQCLQKCLTTIGFLLKKFFLAASKMSKIPLGLEITERHNQNH